MFLVVIEAESSVQSTLRTETPRVLVDVVVTGELGGRSQ
jgi:hypothetical protein